MTTETIQIVITENGSRLVTLNLQGLGNAAERSAGQVDFLQKALGYLTAALAIDKIKQYADAWLTASGLIAVATKSTEELVAVQDQLYAVSQRTRSDYNATVELYARAARAGRELGASQQQLIQFTEGVGKVLVVQHTSAGQAAGSLLQLGQLLSMSKVRAQEFNSVNENLNVLLQVVAKNVDGAGGSVARLRQMVHEGTLTNRMFFDAFLKGQDELNASFDKSAHTIGQSVTVVENAVKRYVGTLNESSGASDTLYKAAEWLAKHLPEVANGLIAVGVAAAVAFAPGAILAFLSAFRTLTVLMYSNPFTAVAAAIASLVSYFYLMDESLLAGIDNITTMKDVMQAFGNVMSETFGGLFEVINSKFEELSGQTFPNFFGVTHSGFAGVLQAGARTFDALAGVIIGWGLEIYRVFEGIPNLASNFFGQMYNRVTTIIQDMINATIDGINRLRQLIGNTTMIEPIKIEQMKVDEDAWQKYGQHVMQSIEDGWDIQGGYFEKSLESLFDRAHNIASARAADKGMSAGLGGVNLNIPLGTPTPALPEAGDIQKAENALRSLLNTIKPSIGAMLDLKHAEDVLNTAMEFGLITLAQKNEYMQLARQHYQDIIDPIGKMNRELNDQTNLLKFNVQQREVETQLLERENQLRQVGITMSPAEREAMRQRLADLQKLNLLTAEQDRLLQDSVLKRQQFTTQIAAIKNMLGSGEINKGDADNAVVNMLPPELLDHTRVQQEAMIASFRDMYSKIRQLRDANLISAQDAASMEARLQLQMNAAKYQDMYTFLGNVETLSQLHSKRAQQIAKAAALAEATIKGIQAVQEALAAPPGWPYNAGMVISVGVMAAANVAKIAGFESGGYTGNYGTSEVAGVVHGQEYVVNAEGTARNRAALEAMNAGATIGGSKTTVIVNNNAEGTKATTQERDTPNGKEIEVIIERVVASQIKSGGRVADAIEGQYGLQRSRGSVR